MVFVRTFLGVLFCTVAGLTTAVAVVFISLEVAMRASDRRDVPGAGAQSQQLLFLLSRASAPSDLSWVVCNKVIRSGFTGAIKDTGAVGEGCLNDSSLSFDFFASENSMNTTARKRFTTKKPPKTACARDRSPQYKVRSGEGEAKQTETQDLARSRTNNEEKVGRHPGRIV